MRRHGAATTASTCCRAKNQFLRELVARVPELAAIAAGRVHRRWLLGRRASGPQDRHAAGRVQVAGFPAHFTRTRCVFSDGVGYCELEKLARSHGQHPWTFKPTTCWMFPLQDDDGEPAEPVRGPEDDPYVAAGLCGLRELRSWRQHDPPARRGARRWRGRSLTLVGAAAAVARFTGAFRGGAARAWDRKRQSTGKNPADLAGSSSSRSRP